MTGRGAALVVAVAAAVLLASCRSDGTTPAATRTAAPPATTAPRSPAAAAPSWDLFERDPIVTYSTTLNNGTLPEYGVVFRTRGPLPRNRQHGTRGQASLNGFGLQYVGQIAKAGRDVCYDGDLTQIDGPVNTTPPLFPYVAGQRVAVGYNVGTRQARPIEVVAKRGPAMDDAEAGKLARRLGCTQAAPYGGQTL